jgi:hypothetical protein
MKRRRFLRAAGASAFALAAPAVRAATLANIQAAFQHRHLHMPGRTRRFDTLAGIAKA